MPFKIVRNDITKVAADAIVNTANPEPKYGSGTDAAVYQAAGAEELLAARKKIGSIAPGECAVTPAFRLPAKHIIHTVGPAWVDGEHGEFDILRSCYRKSLLLADQLGCESIAFPLIATGVYGFPKDKALETALDVIRTHLESSELDVTLVVFNPGAFRIAQGLADKVEAYIDEKYVAAQTAAEYGETVGTTFSTAAAERRAEARRRRLMEEERRREAWRRQFDNAGMPFDAAEEKEMAAPSADAFPPAPSPSAMPQMSMPLQEPVFRPSAAKKAEKAPASGGAPAGAAAKPSSGAAAPSGAAKPSGLSLDQVVKNLGESFQARLLRMIDERGLKDAQVYHGANLSKQVFSRIRCSENYIPTKRTVLALAIGLKLNLDDARDLLASAGYALTDNIAIDLIVRFCIENEIYNMFEVNQIVFKYTQSYLGSTME